MEKKHEHNIYRTFESVALKRGKNTAVIYLGTRYSYERVKELAERFAAALIDMGVTKGDRVIIYIPNSIQWVVTWLGIQRVGALCVPITPIYTPYDLEYIANDCEAEAIVCADTNFGYVTRVLPKTKLKRVIVTKMADLLPWWKRCFGFLFDIIPKGKIALTPNTHSIGNLLSKYQKSPELPEYGQRGGTLLKYSIQAGPPNIQKACHLLTTSLSFARWNR